MKLKTKLMVMALAGVWTLPAWSQTPPTLSCDKSYGFRADVGTDIGTTLCASKADTFLDSVKNFSVSNSK